MFMSEIDDVSLTTVYHSISRGKRGNGIVKALRRVVNELSRLQ